MRIGKWLNQRVGIPRGIAMLLAVALAGAALLIPSYYAESSLPGKILKGGAIGLAVNQFGGQLNKALNEAMANNGFPAGAATKVVPIVSLGAGEYVGAAQVIGPESLVKKVSACVEIRGSFVGKTFRAQIVVPIDSVKNMKRVKGVGVSAVIEVKL
jgi:hypothetical protein